MIKVAINAGIGGFNISQEAFDRLLEMKVEGAIEEKDILDTFLYKSNDLKHKLFYQLNLTKCLYE